MNCLHSFKTENKLTSLEKLCENKDFCGTVMPSEKSDKMPYIINAAIESLIRKIDGCANNTENSSATKIYEHIHWVYSMPTIWGFDLIEDKHTLYHGKDCMKKFCTSLKLHAKNIIDFEKKKMLPLTKRDLKSYQDGNVCYICGKIILKNAKD